jgi:hypothetical protein
MAVKLFQNLKNLTERRCCKNRGCLALNGECNEWYIEVGAVAYFKTDYSFRILMCFLKHLQVLCKEVAN